MVAQVISSYTGLRRFNNCDNSKFLSNLCPHPNMHYLIPSYGKMTLINDYARTELQEKQFIQYLTKKKCQLYQSLLFRQKQLNPFFGQYDLTLNNLDHCFGQSSNIFQCAASNYQVLPEFAQMKLTGSYFSNDASITSRFKQLRESFYKIRQKRAFHSQYQGEGLEDSEFDEARVVLQRLEEDYNSVSSIYNSQIENSNNYEL
ncbi:unnamed protein product [Paramecium octaurelia]|nr:unnamed protein product [Paramecium octaurelia]